MSPTCCPRSSGSGTPRCPRTVSRRCASSSSRRSTSPRSNSSTAPSRRRRPEAVRRGNRRTRPARDRRRRGADALGGGQVRPQERLEQARAGDPAGLGSRIAGSRPRPVRHVGWREADRGERALDLCVRTPGRSGGRRALDAPGDDRRHPPSPALAVRMDARRRTRRVPVRAVVVHEPKGRGLRRRPARRRCGGHRASRPRSPPSLSPPRSAPSWSLLPSCSRAARGGSRSCAPE